MQTEAVACALGSANTKAVRAACLRPAADARWWCQSCQSSNTMLLLDHPWIQYRNLMQGLLGGSKHFWKDQQKP
jgi:hypothetical protein